MTILYPYSPTYTKTNTRWMRMVWRIMHQIGLDVRSFKDKIAAKKENPQRKNANWGQGDARLSVPDSTAAPPPPQVAVKTTGSPWWWSSRVLPPLLECYVLYLFWSACFTYVGSFWTAFYYLLWFTWPQKHLLIKCFELVNLNFAKTHKTTHNTRNRGINRITIDFKPLKWL